MTQAGYKKWIQGMGMKKGALHRQLGVPVGQKIPAKKIAAAKKKAKPGSKLAKRLNLAKTLGKLKK